ncbi:MAG: PDDEXK nuclease domain-containing protein [Bacteroidales bacterium]|jgi:predicted nuclease of restriction endonuclease-like (RecB) superfamily|nr:PDDEXK nuclease domain-containing protein [Bacteroidales bacterium]
MEKNISTNKYNEILREIIAEVKMTRIIIANRLNVSIIQLYWNIGKRLSSEKLEKGYGGKVVEQLSVDLKCEFPDTDGFSPRSLWDMKRFYEFYSEDEQKLPQPVAVSESKILPQVVAVLPWGHNRLILSKIKRKEEALYYAEAAVKMGWTRNLLLNFIKTDTYHNAKELPKLHNFETTLPEHLQEQANEILKNTYNLGFLGITHQLKERELEQRLIEKIKLFLLELGEGFSFIGNQHRLMINEKEYSVDLVFFNRKIKSLIAIDLKIGTFEPEFVGKMNYYLGLLDDQVKMPNENPSIGIILCAEKNHIEVEVALRDFHKPIGVAEYKMIFPENEIKLLISRELNQ